MGVVNGGMTLRRILQTAVPAAAVIALSSVAGLLGSAGQAVLSDAKRGCSVTSEGRTWKWQGAERDDFYQTEHDELFASIRSGQPINNGEYMSKSSLLAIMGAWRLIRGSS